MGYALAPVNKDVGSFFLGAFAFPHLLEQFGCLFPCMQGRGYYCVFGVDPRMPRGDDYPRLISNDGFEITAEEARIMARMARNYVAIQRSLGDEYRHKEELSMFDWNQPWPPKIREDWVDQYEQFADWAEKSGGFAIW